jgi:structural maintenance of chromosome 3 (chondroitin sulfate proteoglycan 6)
MHIKALVLEGFKSYRDRTELGFHEGANLVVGRNGSGKSNVFDAIQFVVSDKYSILRKEIRRRLLHEGASVEAGALSAYVEIIFDNSDGRFPVEGSEVSLKRVIGTKKDEFFLDGKHVTRSDAESLLETAGLSRSNPYNIVVQGKVNALIRMKPKDRLELFKEIAGTKVYEERRAEALKILKDAGVSRQRIQEILDELSKDLQDLGEEKAELLKFQDLDKERRAIEYAVFDKELRTAAEKLQENEDQRLHTSNLIEKFQAELQTVSESREALENSIYSLQRDIEISTARRDALKSEMQDLAKSRASVEYDLERQNARVDEIEGCEEARAAACNALETEIEALNKELRVLTPESDSCNEKESSIRIQIDKNQQRLSELLAKQSRQGQFSSASERNAHLKKELSSRKQTLHKNIELQNSLEKEIEEIGKNIQAMQSEISEKSSQFAVKEKDWEMTASKESELVKKRNSLMDSRKYGRLVL